MPAGTATLVVHRVKIYHETPVAWIVDHTHEGFTEFETLRNEFAGSVLDVLLDHRELPVGSSVRHLDRASRRR